MPKVIDELLSQEMDRKEFLIRVGASALTLVGVAGILKSMSGNHSVGSGYGGGSYGGATRNSKQLHN